MSSGFVFDFGDTAPAPDPSCSDSSQPTAAVVAHDMEPYASISDVVSQWAEAFPKEANKLVETVVDGFHLYHQVPPKVASLEGSEAPRDIVPGKYLGGLKVWSCARDVATFMCRDQEIVNRLRQPKAQVIEVGCGQGLPSMMAVLLGAHTVTCHDYNQEVLHLCTLPNIATTCRRHFLTQGREVESRPVMQHMRVGYGDWDDIGSDDLYDVVLGSDVTYDPEACAKLSRLLCRVISKPHGCAIIGTKEYYFGTNGGLQEFLSALSRASNGALVGVVRERLGYDSNELHRVIVQVQWAV